MFEIEKKRKSEKVRMKKEAKEGTKGALKHEHFHLAVNKQNTMNLVEDEEERKNESPCVQHNSL